MKGKPLVSNRKTINRRGNIESFISFHEFYNVVTECEKDPNSNESEASKGFGIGGDYDCGPDIDEIMSNICEMMKSMNHLQATLI